MAKHIANHGDSFPSVYFTDADDDGYGDADAATSTCPNPGFVADSSDCNDADAGVNPGAEEVPSDGVDNDCATGTRDDDLDNDGFGIADDCNDDDASVNPGAEEVCDDETDNNCDASIDEGCATDCPCYTAADIDAAYAASLAAEALYDWSSFDYSYEYNACYEYDYDYDYSYYNYESNGSEVYWSRYGYDADYWYGYEDSDYDYASVYASAYGWSYSYDDTYGWDYSAVYCNAYSGHYAYDYYTGAYVSEYTENFQYIDETQKEACEQVAMDWAADNGLTCESYSYHN